MPTKTVPIVLSSLLLFALSALLPLAAQDLPQLNDETIKKFETITSSGKFPQELQALFTQLDDKNQALRIKAVQALSLVGGPMAALLLIRSIDDDMERAPAVRSAAAKGLGDIGGRQALETLGIAIKDRDVTVRLNTVEALRWAGTLFAVPFIQEALRSDPSLGVRLKAVLMLRKIGTQFSTQPLHEALMGDRDLGLRLAAADALTGDLPPSMCPHPELGCGF
jgi:HEAT repeat protein